MSRSLFTLSLKCFGTLLARCFLKTASDFSGRCSGECLFLPSNFDVDIRLFNIKSANCSKSCWLI